MNPTRRLILALPALAVGAAVFALPAATAQAAAPTGIVLEKPKPKDKPQVCTKTESSSSVVTLGGCMTKTTITCEKGKVPVISTTTSCTATRPK